MCLVDVAELSVLQSARVPAVVVTSGLHVGGEVLSDLRPVYTSLPGLGLILRPDVNPLIVFAILLQSHFAVFFRSCELDLDIGKVIKFKLPVRSRK